MIDPVAKLRRAVDDAHGRMIVVPRVDVESVLALIGCGHGSDAVMLTIGDAERLARAAWDSADGPDDRVTRFGRWGVNNSVMAAHQVDAARRTLAYLVAEQNHDAIGSPQ